MPRCQAPGHGRFYGGGGTLPRMATVELHVISDATGATAKRLVQALEAQFPDQEFEDIIHPRVETVDDLRLAVDRAKGRPAVMLYTLVEQSLREEMRALCRRARVHYCDILGHPIDAVARVSGAAATMTPGARPPLDSNYFKRMAAIEFASSTTTVSGVGWRRPTSSSSGSPARRRRRSRCISATSDTAPRTSRL